MPVIKHTVKAIESFGDAANAIFNLIDDAQKRVPDEDRVLFLDIDGHRNLKGGFDNDMLELQSCFLLQFAIKFLVEIHCPLTSVKNKEKQINIIPEVNVISENKIKDFRNVFIPDKSAMV